MRVAVTGAAGRIGTAVSEGLAANGHDVVRLDWERAAGVHVVDVGDATALAPLIGGCAAVVHLAANPGETSLEEALDSHVKDTHGVLEAMRAAAVRRMVYASSHHAVGFTQRVPLLSTGTRPRPDTFYGLGKAATEALCSLYTDRFGIEVVCVRIGIFAERPRSRLDLSTWLSPGDAVRLVEACLTAPELSFAVVYGISANTRGWWDIKPARALGYRPMDDAEVFAAEILATPETADDVFAAQHAGGEFCRPDWLGGNH